MAPETRLAVHVLAAALFDARRGDQAAQAWLTTWAEMAPWAAMARVDPAFVTRLARRALARRRRRT